MASSFEANRQAVLGGGKVPGLSSGNTSVSNSMFEQNRKAVLSTQPSAQPTFAPVDPKVTPVAPDNIFEKAGKAVSSFVTNIFGPGKEVKNPLPSGNKVELIPPSNNLGVGSNTPAFDAKFNATPKQDKIMTEAARFGIRTAFGVGDITSEALDYMTDYLAHNLVDKSKPTYKPIADLNDKWIKFYDEQSAKGNIPTQKFKDYMDTLQSSKFVQSDPEWEKATLKEKLTTKLGETLLNIGPSVISSAIPFIINPALGFVVSAGSTANDVKDIGKEYGLGDSKAEKLGLATGLIVGALDKIVPDDVMNTSVKKKFIDSFIKRIVKTTLTETSTEMVQETVQMLAEKTFREDLGWDEFKTRNVMAGLGGFFGGVGFSMIGNFSDNTIKKELLGRDINNGGIDPGEYTPEEIRGKIIGTDLQNTEEGNAIIRASLVAEERGQNIKISRDDLKTNTEKTGEPIETTVTKTEVKYDLVGTDYGKKSIYINPEAKAGDIITQGTDKLMVRDRTDGEPGLIAYSPDEKKYAFVYRTTEEAGEIPIPVSKSENIEKIGPKVPDKEIMTLPKALEMTENDGGVLYHGSQSDSIDLPKVSSGRYGKGFYLTTSPLAAENAGREVNTGGGRVRSNKTANVFSFDISKLNIKKIQSADTGYVAPETLAKEGFDGVTYVNEGETLIFNTDKLPPAIKIKSKDKPALTPESEKKDIKNNVSKHEFKVGDVLDPQGNTNMKGKVTITEIVGNTLKFTDSSGTEYAGMQKSLVRDLINGGSWKIESKSTQTEMVKESVKETPKSIKEIAEETKIKEPNIRRILGVGEKEGTFERVDKGVYVLSKDGVDTAFIETGNSLESLPRLAKNGFKADMIFLDIPYNTKAVRGGNRGINFATISPTDFKDIIVPSVKTIAKNDDSAIVYMYSQGSSGKKDMMDYNKALMESGLIVVAKGTYSKTYKNGEPMKFGKYPMPPEGILVYNRSGKDVDLPKSFDIKAIAPLYKNHYQTEKASILLKSIIEGTTNFGDMVLDPFSGSGVTLAEAVKLGRKAYGVEISEKAVEEKIKPRVREALTLAPSKATTEKKLLREASRAGVAHFVDFKRGTGKNAEYYKPSVGRNEMKTLLTNKEFIANPILTVIESGEWNPEGTEKLKLLEFKGEKFEVTLDPRGMKLNLNKLKIGEKVRVDAVAMKKAIGVNQTRIFNEKTNQVLGYNPKNIGDEIVEAKTMIDRAIKEHGTTNVAESIGFITPDGRAIDSSGRKQGSQSEGRNVDHREIAMDALPYESTINNGSEALIEFMNKTKSIRIVSAGANGLNIDTAHYPSEEQFEYLRKLARKSDGIYADISKLNGDKAKSGHFKSFSEYEEFLRNYFKIKDLYPNKIYKAYNETNGTKTSKSEIDKLSFRELRDTASMGLEGGREEFDKLIKDHEEPAKTGGDYGFNPKNIEDINSPKADVELDKVVKQRDIAKNLAEKLGIPIRNGKFRHAGAIGLYKGGPKVARIKSGGLNTVFHEAAGHFLDDMFNFSQDIDVEERKALMTEYGFSYEGQPTKQKKEAFAEFMRFYLTSQDVKLNEYAPRFKDFFDDTIQQMPDVQAILEEARRDYKRWQEQPAVAKILSHLSVGTENSGKFKDKVTNTLHDLYTVALDDLHPLGEYSELAKKNKVELPSKVDPYILARNLRGWVGKANLFLEEGTFGKTFWKVNEKGKTVIDFKGKGYKEIMAPIIKANKLNEFRVYLVAKRIVVDLDERKIRTGISVDDAKTAVEELETKYPYFKDVAEERLKFKDQLLQFGVENGIIGPKGYAKIKELNKFHVPFYRVMEESQAGFLGKNKIAGNLSSPVKKIKGSERTIIDPLESDVKDVYAIINAAERNNIGIAMANLASKNYELGRLFEEVVKPMKPVKLNTLEVMKKVFKDTDVTVEDLPLDQMEETILMFQSTYASGPNMLNVNMGDKQKVFQVDPDLFKAIQGLNVEDIGTLMKILSFPAKLLRAGATLTPDFSIRNPVRDQFSAFVYSQYGFKPGIDLFRGMFELMGNTDVYKLWKAGGGEHSMAVSLDRTKLQENFKDLMAGNGRKLTGYIKNPIKFLQVISELGEMGTRLGEMRNALESKVDPITGAFASREITLDFARIGAKTKAMNAITAFWNANLQGTDKMIRSFKTRPFRTLTKTFLGITLPSILLYLANRDDERWKEIPAWQKNLFWIVMTKDHIYRIPKPFELGVIFGSVPERLLEYMDSKDPKIFNELTKAITDGFTPGFLPTALIPIIENITNYSFFSDRPIVPRGQENLPPEAQSGTYTSEIAKIIGQALGYSPSKIDNLIQGYTGGLGKYAVDATDKILEGTGVITPPVPPALNFEDMPILKAFMIRKPIGSNSESVNRVYDMYGKTTAELNYVKLLVKLNDTDRAKEYIKKHPEVAYAQPLNTLVTFFSEMNRGITEVRNSKTLTADQKREKINQLGELQTELSQKFLQNIKQELMEQPKSKLLNFKLVKEAYAAEGLEGTADRKVWNLDMRNGWQKFFDGVTGLVQRTFRDKVVDPETTYTKQVEALKDEKRKTYQDMLYLREKDPEWYYQNIGNNVEKKLLGFDLGTKENFMKSWKGTKEEVKEIKTEVKQVEENKNNVETAPAPTITSEKATETPHNDIIKRVFGDKWVQATKILKRTDADGVIRGENVQLQSGKEIDIENRIDPKTGLWDNNAPVKKFKNKFTGQVESSTDRGLFRINNSRLVGPDGLLGGRVERRMMIDAGIIDESYAKYNDITPEMAQKLWDKMLEPENNIKMAKILYDLNGGWDAWVAAPTEWLSEKRKKELGKQ